VLLAYVKIVLEREILDSEVPDEPWTADVLRNYFPTPLRERYASLMDSHALHREIVTTRLVNETVNRGGTSFVYRAVEESGATAEDVIRAFMVVRDVYGLADLWRAVEELDNKVPTAAQTAVYLQVRRLMDRAVRWLVTNRRAPLDVAEEIGRLRPGVALLLPKLDELLRGRERDSLKSNVDSLVGMGVPVELAERATRVLYGFGLLDVVSVADRSGRDVAEVAEVYFALSERFRVDDLLSKISMLPRDDRWQTLARMALRYDLYAALAALTSEVLGATDTGTPAPDRLAAWERANATAISRTRNAIGEFDGSPAELAALSVLLRQIRTLVNN